MLERLFANLQRYLERALRGGNTSQFTEMCAAYQILHDILEFCRDDPNGVLTNLGIAGKVIADNLAKGQYRDEENLSALIMVIERAETQLRADHPEVREANDRFVAQKLRDADDATKIAIAEGFREMQQDVTKGRLAAEYGSDALVLETDSGAEAQADAVKRSGGRTGEIARDMAERGVKAAKDIDSHGAFKATGIALRLQKLVELLAPLF